MDDTQAGAGLRAVPSAAKQPRTERGRKTLRKLLDAAAVEFGEKGFHDASISAITNRAETALGTFYTYFDSKDEIFRALVNDMSTRVRHLAGEALSGIDETFAGERAAFGAFLKFAREHKEIYRIIDEAEFVDPESYRIHYESTAKRIEARLKKGAERGEVRADIEELHVWAIMGMNVFLGLRYCMFDDSEDPEDVAARANDFLRRGLQPL